MVTVERCKWKLNYCQFTFDFFLIELLNTVSDSFDKIQLGEAAQIDSLGPDID